MAALAALVLIVAVQPPEIGSAQPRRLGAAVAPLRLVPAGSDPIRIDGLHSYFGTIEVSAAADGLVLSDRLALERYLLGLAEVPLTWPEEALKAQAVAARTYALYTLRRPRAGSAASYGFDICASVQCQVFSGADVVAPATGARWRSAVAETEGLAVLFDGEPILARYHSTSGGQTLDNPQAFPEEPAYPYLQGVPSTTEEASPLYRWTVEFPLKRMQALLRAAGFWPETNGRLLEVRSRPSRAGFHYPDLVMRGRKGSATATAEDVRSALRELAPQMFPGDYPSRGATSSGRLPETFPSNRVAVFTTGKTVRVIGRGWGHGVGMSQWGAHGLAARGASFTDILGHYYTGVTVGRFPDPGPIEVGVGWGRSEAQVQGEFKIVDGRGRTLVKNALGRWGFAWGGTGVVRISPPEGFGLPLRVGLVRAPKRVQVGATVFLTVALSRPAKVRTVTRAPTAYRDPGVTLTDPGRQRIMWAAPLEEGRFSVRVEATAGGTRSRTKPVEIEVFSKPVAGRGSPAARPERGESESVNFPILLGTCIAAVLVLAGFGLWARTGRKLDE